jgi:DNA-binding LacI/PurR family transcriptional regulator
VSREKAEAVRAARVRLGYRPNVSARALRTGATRTVGLVVPQVTNPFFGRLLHGAQVAARAEGHVVAMIDAANERAWELEFVETLTSGPTDGLILYGFAPPRADELGPLVLLDVLRRGVPSVRLDNRSGGRQVAEHLLGLGPPPPRPPRLAYRLPFFEDRWAGIADAAARDGAEVHAVATDFRYDAARDATHRLLDEHPATTALIAEDDLIAGGALIALRERGLRVPRGRLRRRLRRRRPGDRHGSRRSRRWPPTPSRWARPPSACCTAASPGAASPRDTVLPVELVVRESTGPPPAR